jgi:hypothetical protein
MRQLGSPDQAVIGVTAAAGQALQIPRLHTDEREPIELQDPENFGQEF